MFLQENSYQVNRKLFISNLRYEGEKSASIE